jgi:hypothetical protein
MVDEAKAFCPGCGNAFVEEEKRTTVSDFDKSNKTVQLGSTMYHQLLSDMGLSTSKGPNQGEVTTGEPAAAEPVAPPPVQIETANSAKPRWLIWVTVAAASLLFLLVLVVLVVLFMLWQRFA